MLSKIKPDFYFSGIEEIPLQQLKNKGIKGLIVDLDNTLTDWNSLEIKPYVDKWLKKLKDLDFKICIVSNNNVSRISCFLKELQIPFISNAFKPRKRAFLKAMQLLNTEPSSTAVIGDQLFTDILGGKRVGMTTILVSPLSSKEFIGTKIVRKLEKMILTNF